MMIANSIPNAALHSTDTRIVKFLSSIQNSIEEGQELEKGGYSAATHFSGAKASIRCLNLIFTPMSDELRETITPLLCRQQFAPTITKEEVVAVSKLGDIIKSDKAPIQDRRTAAQALGLIIERNLYGVSKLAHEQLVECGARAFYAINNLIEALGNGYPQHKTWEIIEAIDPEQKIAVATLSDVFQVSDLNNRLSLLSKFEAMQSKNGIKIIESELPALIEETQKRGIDTHRDTLVCLALKIASQWPNRTVDAVGKFLDHKITQKSGNLNVEITEDQKTIISFLFTKAISDIRGPGYFFIERLPENLATLTYITASINSGYLEFESLIDTQNPKHRKIIDLCKAEDPMTLETVNSCYPNYNSAYEYSRFMYRFRNEAGARNVLAVIKASREIRDPDGTDFTQSCRADAIYAFGSMAPLLKNREIHWQTVREITSLLPKVIGDDDELPIGDMTTWTEKASAAVVLFAERHSRNAPEFKNSNEYKLCLQHLKNYISKAEDPENILRIQEMFQRARISLESL
jgi:hypothetical protein